MTRSISAIRSRRAMPSPLVVPPAPCASTLKTVAPLYRRIARALLTPVALVACLMVSGVAMAAYVLMPGSALSASAAAPERQVAAGVDAGHLPRVGAG